MSALFNILNEIISLGISVNVCQTNGVQEIRFNNGFYKSDGIAVLFERDGDLFLKTRYHQENKIATVDDVVAVSKEWWYFSRDRCDSWANPHCDWVNLYNTV